MQRFPIYRERGISFFHVPLSVFVLMIKEGNPHLFLHNMLSFGRFLLCTILPHGSELELVS